MYQIFWLLLCSPASCTLCLFASWCWAGSVQWGDQRFFSENSCLETQFERTVRVSQNSKVMGHNNILSPVVTQSVRSSSPSMQYLLLITTTVCLVSVWPEGDANPEKKFWQLVSTVPTVGNYKYAHKCTV